MIRSLHGPLAKSTKVVVIVMEYNIDTADAHISHFYGIFNIDRYP